MAGIGATFMDQLKKTRLAYRAETVPSHKFEKVGSMANTFRNKNKIKQITVKAIRQAEEDMRMMGVKGSPGGGQRDGGKEAAKAPEGAM